MDPRVSAAATPATPSQAPSQAPRADASGREAELAAAGKALEASLEAFAGQGRALLTLAGRELGLGAALLGRALVLSLIGLAAGLLTVGLAAALLVALGLALGLGWPGALAAAAALMLGVALICRTWSSKLLAEAQLPATRRQLGALMRHRSAGPAQETPV
jgi:uncharacterized membrane protein YbhN (UPF0104 family)